MNSHIQVPNFILKNFREQSGRIYYLRVSDMYIGMTKTKKIGTEQDYFSQGVEESLSEEIEAPFSKLVRAVVQNNGTLAAGKLSIEETENLLKRYVDALILRSGMALNIMQKNSFTADMCSRQENHDDLAMLSVNANSDISFTKDTFMLILSNDAGTELVVPRNGFYFISMSGVCTWVIPISPKYAFALRPKIYAEIELNDKNHCLVHIQNDEDVQWMNFRAMTMEIECNGDCIASSSREELERLKNYASEHGEGLENVCEK